MNKRLMLIFAWALLALLVPCDSYADTCNVTNLPTSGTLTAARINARFTQVESCVNGNLDEANLQSSSAIENSKLAAPNNYIVVTTQLACGDKTSAYQFRLPQAATLDYATFRCRDCSAPDDHTIDIQINGSTVSTFANITGSTTQENSSIASAASTGQDIEIDTTETTAGSCTAYDVTMFFTTAHAS